MMWFWVGYISIGLWILMPGLVYAWEDTDHHPVLKVIGSIVAVLVWPLAFMDLK